MSGGPDLELLSAFVAVAEHGSFSRAASALRLPKSSISRRVSRLEQALHTPLFYRSTRALGLTGAGTELFSRVSPLLAAVGSALGALRETRAVPEGELRIAAASETAGALLSDVLARYTQRYPAVRVVVSLSREFEDLVANGVDLALRLSGRPLRDSSLQSRKLATIGLQLYASPNYLARRGEPATINDLAQHDWISVPTLDAALKLAPAHARRAVETHDLSFARDLLVAGAGIAPLPTFMCREQLAWQSVR